MIQYANILRSNKQDQYSQIFSEAVEMVKNTCHINPLGGAEDLYGDSGAFTKYIEKLTEGFSPEDTETLQGLLQNNRMQVLQEASLGSIPPITSLNAPTIIKMWAKSGLKNVIPTQVVDKPVFSVLSNRPYMLKADGTKVYLPEGLTDDATRTVGDIHEKLKITLDVADMAKTIDLATKDADGVGATGRLSAEEMSYVKITKIGAQAVNVNMSLERRFFVTTLDGNNVFGQVDLEARTCVFAQTAAAPVAIELEIGVSNANHTRSTEVSFEVERRDFEIPTGEHFEVNLPLEFINDMYALYKIDSASTATETMSNIISQKLEQEIDQFLTVSIGQRDVAFKKAFNVHPNTAFAMQPKDWVEELKRIVDYLAMLMKNKSYFYQGYFVIYGNPIDTALLPNVSWTFNSASDNVNGINANYSVGAMSGSNKYVIVSSDLVASGALKMIMVPTVEDYKTFMYYPYTFNIVNNYLNAQGKKTMPNLMMTKRHIMAEFMNLSAEITISGNDGTIAYQTV